MPDDRIKRTIVVTGGSRGIGRAICTAFAHPDNRIFFNYTISENEAKQTETLVAEAGGEARAIQGDVASVSDMERFFKTIMDETGRVDVLAVNAGITRDGLIVRMAEADWDAVLDTNLKGAFTCIKLAARPMMKQRYGRIITIASVAGVAGNPGQANYAASKAGLIGLTKSAARELAPRNITVNAVAPGFIETEMTASLPETLKADILKQIPLGRAGGAGEVAAVCEFLASDKAAYITGQVIHINGGMYI
jgi:3-oxoacyl-[acyl-carrier protein] reductase